MGIAPADQRRCNCLWNATTQAATLLDVKVSFVRFHDYPSLTGESLALPRSSVEYPGQVLINAVTGDVATGTSMSGLPVCRFAGLPVCRFSDLPTCQDLAD